MLGFRVWNVQDNQMVDMEYDSKYSDWTFSMDYLGSIGYEVKHYIAMQSTGLKDVNSIVIYEGDIIEALERKSLYEVTNVIDFIFFFKSKVGWYNRMLRQTIQFKIIGNIYENSELLEKVKC
jgi:uncharacterized phage protein (TIGR01671 family)